MIIYSPLCVDLIISNLERNYTQNSAFIHFQARFSISASIQRINIKKYVRKS